MLLIRENGRFLIGLTLGLIGLTGCPSPDSKSCATYAGIETDAITGELVSYAADGVTVQPIADGGTIYISGAPQGGRIIYAGAYATNLNPCEVTLQGELLTPDGGAALTNLDSRQSNFSVSESGNFFGPGDGYSALPNIPVCDNAVSVVGPAILQITVTDANGKSAVIQSPVVVACVPGDENCVSTCGPH